MPKVAVVTDSTASLDPATAEAEGITIVPLQLVLGEESYSDGVDEEATPARVAEALRQQRPVSTSRPAPQVVLNAYERLAADGAEAIVSVHLSSQVSATYESAQIAARTCSVPVRVVDTGHVGAGTGYAALAAARAARRGEPMEAVAAAAQERASRTTSLFYVDTLEFLRKGGRVGTAAALVGSALAVKPILGLQDGRIATLAKVRTSGRAIARLEEMALAAAEELGAAGVEVTVCHLANESAARDLAGRVQDRLKERLGGEGPPGVHEVGAVLGAHVGPGLLGVIVTPALEPSQESSTDD